MANAISDNRTLLNAADAVTNWTNVAGVAAGVLDVDTFVQGTGSVAFNLTNAIEGLLYNNGATIDLSASTVFVWFNTGIAGKLDTKAGGGVRVRFAGPTATNFFELYVAGSDTYSGGWTMFVIDVASARSTAVTNGWTGGTPPASSAIQRIGVVGDTAGFMTKKQDNFFVDAIWYLANTAPGMIVEGRNGGTTDWKWSDILASSVAGGWGMARQTAGGTISLNAPIRFGTNDATTHGFSDTNARIEWDDQPVASTFYGLTVIGGSGTQSFTMGVKAGTGATSTGSQGCVIGAKSTGQRWYFDADDANVDLCGLYGCTFIHSGDLQLDDPQVEMVSTLLIDGLSARIDNALFVRNSIIAAATADGVGYVTTDDISDVDFCNFTFSDGHGITIVSGTGGTQSSQGNKFSGYGGTPGTNSTPSSGSTDAAVYNNTGGALTINVTDSGDSPSVRNAASSTTTVAAAITITFTGLVVGTEVRVFTTSGDVEVSGTESTAGTTYAASLQASTSYYVRVIALGYLFFQASALSFTASQDYPVNLRVDNNFRNP